MIQKQKVKHHKPLNSTAGVQYCRLLMAMLLLTEVISGFKSSAQAAPKPPTEYEIKAACIYNLLKYVDFPKGKSKESTETKELSVSSNSSEKKSPQIVIGVVGKDPFGKAWNIIRGKKVKGRTLAIQLLGKSPKTGNEENAKILREKIQKCQVVFFSASEQKNVKQILGWVNHAPVMTLSETDKFLEQGGIVNFVLEKKKVRFEINLDAAKKAQIQFKTTVLKLAKRVIQSKKGAAK